MNARLLLVDDDSGMRLTLGALLEEAGWAVAEAASCAEAKRALAEAAPFDVVILDCHLRDGLGTTLIPCIRERGAVTKIVLASGDEAIDAEADAVFVKGAPSAQLLSLVATLSAR